MKQGMRRAALSVLLLFSLLALNGCPIEYEIAQRNPLGAALMALGAFRYNPSPPPQAPAAVETSRSHVPGAQTPFSLILGPLGKTIEIYTIVISVPDAFTFHGFNAVGAVGGSYQIVTPPSTIRLSANLRAITADTAYIDLNGTGAYEPQWEPYITHGQAGGSHQFTITQPYGGDGNPTVNYRNITDIGVLVLASGILTNPPTPGTYTATATFTSVDPDTGGPDDGQGTPPETATASKAVVITSGPAVDIVANATNYSTGQRQDLYVYVSNPGTQVVVDAYVAVMLPDGSLLFVSYDSLGTPTFHPGTGDPATWTPLVTNLTLPSGFNLEQCRLLQYTFTGGEPAGTYTWFVGLTSPGTKNPAALDWNSFRYAP